METYHFTSNLLVVAPEFAGNDFRWIDTITGQSSNGHTEECNVLVFNVENKAGIKPMLEAELNKLQAIEEPEEQDVHNMAYIESVLRELGDSTFEHDAPAALLETIGRCARKTFRQSDVIYLSGITAIRK